MAAYRNAILSRINRDDDGGLFDALTMVALDVGQVIQEPGAPAKYCFFPESGLLSMVKVDGLGSTVECAAVGHMYGINVGSVAVDALPIVRAVAQQPVRVWRAELSALRAACDRSQAVRQSISAAQAHLIELTQLNVACNGLHQGPERLARWILRADDFSSGRLLRITQGFLAQMLGLRRPTVSAASSELQNGKIISYARGRLSVLDRDALEKRTCSCYRQEIDLNIHALRHPREWRMGIER